MVWKIRPYATNDWFLRERLDRTGSSVRGLTNQVLPDPGWSGWGRRAPGPRIQVAPNETIMRSKEKKGYHSSDRSIITYFLLYIGLAIEFLMWSQITFLLSIRLTGSQQIGFKVLSLWGRNIFEKVKVLKNSENRPRSKFNNKYFSKGNKYFSKT